MNCTAEQTVNLLAKGFTADELDAQPYLYVSGRTFSDLGVGQNRYETGHTRMFVYCYGANGAELKNIELQKLNKIFRIQNLQFLEDFLLKYFRCQILVKYHL